jgi:hypothetical protein
LRRILAKPGRSPPHTAKLVDDRHVKAAATPYVLFYSERHASGDLKGIPVGQAAKIASAEWKALSAAEKKVCSLTVLTAPTLTSYQKYEDAYAASKRTLATAS